MPAVTVPPMDGAGRLVRLLAWVRGLVSRRVLYRLAGVDVVVLAGHVCQVRAVPLGVARNMVPALVRASQAFAAWRIDEALYDDLVIVLATGLGLDTRTVERLPVALWELGPVIEALAQANGLPTVEAGRAAQGKPMNPWTGMPSTPSSSPPPAGHGTTSTNG